MASRAGPTLNCLDCGAPSRHARCNRCQAMRNKRVIEEHKQLLRRAFSIERADARGEAVHADD
jgi:hypothetical protein